MGMEWLLIILLFGAIFLGVPISFAIAASSLVILFTADTPAMTPWILVQRTYTGIDNFVLLAIPLFLLTALIMNESGVTDRLIKFAYVVIGTIRGGLALVNVLTSMIFAGFSGSSVADVAGTGSALIPAMYKKGYSKEFTVAVTCASSVIAQIMPPKVMAIIYASTVGLSVGALFMAGVLPALLLGIMLLSYSFYVAKKHNYPSEVRISFKESIKIIITTSPALVCPLIVIGGIVGGFFTPTEAAVVAVVYAMVLAFIFYRTMTLKKLWKCLVNTGIFSSVTLLCIGVASVFGHILAYYRVPVAIGNWLTGITDNPIVFLLLIFVVFLLVGSFLDATPAIIMMAPIVAPIGVLMGVHPIHTAMVVITTLAMGLITPPYGLALLVACQIGKLQMAQALPTMLKFYTINVILVIFTIFFPDAILFLPRLMFPQLNI